MSKIHGTATTVGIEATFADLQSFYRDFFDLKLDFSQVRIPERRAGFNRLLITAQGFTPNRVFEVCQEHFKCWRATDDLDMATRGRNDREPTEHYAIWVRDRQEADEELKNLSADDLKEKNIPGITLLEREIYELKYWSETSEHLDMENVTLCSGSRGAYGGVPNASYGGEFDVGWYSPGDSYGSLRSRQAVS